MKTTKKYYKFFDPGQTYISVSFTAGRRLREMGVFPDDKEFVDFRKCIVKAIKEDAEPIPATSETHFLATARIKNNTVDREVCLICVLTKGSPMGNFEHTLLIRGVMSIDEASRVLSKNKGLTNLKFDETVLRIGNIHT